jgi:hypothetical protein
VVGNRIFRIGGRSNPLLVTSYDTVANTWQTTGWTNAPVSGDSSCAGTYNNVIYMWKTGGTAVRTFTPGTNSWNTLPAASNVPQNTSCYMQHAPLWRNRLIFVGGQQIEQFDPATGTWLPGIPLPVVTGVTGIRWSLAVAGAANDLFVVGNKSQDTTVYINKWVFN